MNSPEITTETAAPKSGMVTKMIVAAFLTVLAVTECLLAYFLIPSAEQVAARAEAHAAAHQKQQEDEEHGEHGGIDHDSVVEVELGQYSITSHQPASNMTLRIDFDLTATVDKKQQSEFQHIFGNHEHRLRDTVIFEIRNAELTDLTDPGLGLIKRRILEKSNRMFGKPLLHNIMFSNYSFYEQ